MSDDSASVSANEGWVAPDLAVLLGPFVASIPEASRPGFLCLLERTAAGRYREWAEQCPEESEGLLACAGREDEIADRVERLMPADAADRGVMESEVGKARSAYVDLFAGLTLGEQWRIQASAERQGAAAWRGIAAQADESLRPALESCAKLEEESAAHLEALLARRS